VSQAQLSLKRKSPSRRKPVVRTDSVQKLALDWVKTQVRPVNAVSDQQRKLRIADLFCGCGGMSLGASEAARRRGRSVQISLAVDSNKDALGVYRANVHAIRDSASRCVDILSLFDGEIGSNPTLRERTTLKQTGQIDLLLAGPPCQGHSDLNNSTRRKDPRNLLYLRAVRAIEILDPQYAFIENVPTVIHDSCGVVQKAISSLKRIGYTVSSALVDVRAVGLPQRRRRHLLFATRTPKITISELVDNTMPSDSAVGPFLRGLEQEPTESDCITSKPARMTPENLARVKYLFDHDLHDLPDTQRPPCHRDQAHSYQSSYGRLKWDAPTPTITSGFGSMGQGRFVHPTMRRLITPHEAARIQGFPDYFDFTKSSGLTSLRTMIGNAVPPPLMLAVVGALLDLESQE